MSLQFLFFSSFFACSGDKEVCSTDTAQVIVNTDGDGDGFDNDSDCNDLDATINPGAEELCDNLDNNCDGQIDEGVTTVYYLDADADGFGDESAFIESCEVANRYVANGNDCDDTNETVYPGAPELCDGIDNDCNNDVDDNLGSTWFVDSDLDGYGDPDQPFEGCLPGPGYSDNDLDCDDTQNSINPGAEELCDTIDNNCDGTIDEAVTFTYYLDADGDGFGDPNNVIEACSEPIGYTQDNTDCDDEDATMNPDAVDLNPFDGVDLDCDGVDGDHDDAIHVSITNGSSSNDGSLSSPVNSIHSGIDLASSSGKSYVLVAEGSYNENITLADGLIIMGGMTEVFEGRTIFPPSTSIVGEGSSPTVVASGITSGATIDGFYIEGNPNNEAGASSIAFFIEDSTDALNVINNIIFSNDAKDGTNGSDGLDGDDGAFGSDGAVVSTTTCTAFPSVAAGGVNICGTDDVSGGDGGNFECPDYSEIFPARKGSDGLGMSPGVGGEGACDGGVGILNCSTCSIEVCYGTGDIGIDGDDGTNGNGGLGALSTGGFSGYTWVTVDGTDGVIGVHGSGGGGGGTGSGAEVLSFCSGDQQVGGGGGSGGAGGCGGEAGQRGTGGGSSYGLVYSCSTTCTSFPIVTNNEISSGAGGLGGNGGDGGLGGIGGEGGLGGEEDRDIAYFAAAGGAGGDGGFGGDGGGGGGGAGGNSYAVFVVNTTPDSTWTSANVLDAGLPGLGGRGGVGANQNFDGTNGVNGEYSEQNF